MRKTACVSREEDRKTVLKKVNSVFSNWVNVICSSTKRMTCVSSSCTYGRYILYIQYART